MRRHGGDGGEIEGIGSEIHEEDIGRGEGRIDRAVVLQRSRRIHDRDLQLRESEGVSGGFLRQDQASDRPP